MTKFDLKHSKKMITFTTTDPDSLIESREWAERVAKNEENLESLRTQIRDLEEINQRENVELLSAQADVKDVKLRIADAKERLGQLLNLIEVHSQSTKQPQIFSPKLHY